MMQPYTPHGDSNPPEWLALLLLAGCNLLPLALCRFLRRTCKVLAKTGALLRVAVSQISIAHAVRSQIWTAAPTPARLLLPQAAPRLRCQPRLRCFVRWTRSPRLPLTGTVTRLSMLLATVPRMQPYTPHGDSNGHRWLLSSCQRTRCNLIPLTGTVTISSIVHAIERMPMQPYTPHGDSNSSTTAPPMVRSDATLYPSRGQ